jgi:ribosomal protein S18 acetylase RimI-like enzyme
MGIVCLRDTPVEVVHQAFVDAFSDYEVSIQMPLDKFMEMMRTRDLKLEYSLGWFEADRLVGFLLVGCREIDRRKCFYDGGTGIIKEYRRKGIGNELIAELIDSMKLHDISSFILEVLESNIPAIELYRKHGFVITRKYQCYNCLASEIAEINDHPYLWDCNIDDFLAIDPSKYIDFEPSWQNSSVSIHNSIENYEYVAIIHDSKTIAYGLVHKTRGDIPQIGVQREWRNFGVESILVGEIKKRTKSEKLACLNIEEYDYMTSKLEKIGFENFINQYEMRLDL